MEGVDTILETIVLEAVEAVVINYEETGGEVVEAVDPVVMRTNNGNMVSVPTDN